MLTVAHSLNWIEWIMIDKFNIIFVFLLYQKPSAQLKSLPMQEWWVQDTDNSVTGKGSWWVQGSDNIIFNP